MNPSVEAKAKHGCAILPRVILKVPSRLRARCEVSLDRRLWLERLPDVVAALAERWALVIDAPFDHEEISSAWVAPATRADGLSAVLKITMPHFEGRHEIDGLRLWDGDGMVRLLEADDGLGAMLLERCEPGTALRALPEAEQDVVIARLLRRLRRPAPPSCAFRRLSEMLAYWTDEIIARREAWTDPGLTRDGLQIFDQLSRPAPGDVVLVTDLHAGNVLRSRREDWLAIDPKPFIGDPTYDGTQHLLNCRGRLFLDAEGTIRRFADGLEVDHERLRAWMFARLAAEASEEPAGGDAAALARKLAP